ncbi:MAG: response regulator transcription factor [Cyanobacteria bacterium P01_D01_bin.44]
MIRLVICADNPITRTGLESMVASPDIHPGIHIVDSVAQLAEVKRGLTPGSLDALLLVAELNDELLQSLAELMAAAGQFGTILLVDDQVERRGISQVLSLGAVGLLPTSISVVGLRDAIATVVHGLSVIHPDFIEIFFTHSPTLLDDEADLIEPLTPREIEVLDQLAQGLSNKAIAKRLNISEHTVKFHISALLSKLNATSRTEAVALGLRQGLIML